MVDDMKNRSDRILKNILSGIAGATDPEGPAKDLISGLLSKAGRSKDEVIQILGREIGLALAAVLAKPLEQITENKRIRVTVELIPKAKKKSHSQSKRKNAKRKPTPE